ncbi:MAG: hypothetical protein GF365_01780 [Candidatus Buchananbacteria bacterium]|nr:hypothetical protein [Candidatus Buchananbacteria bacterium]
MKIKKIITILLIISTGIFLLTGLVAAQSPDPAEGISGGVQSFGDMVYGGEPKPPAQLAALIIKSALTLLGILFVALLIYGGYLYMTAQGKEDQIKKAKQTIIAATIGVAIIVMSYAIASFILNAVIESSGPGYTGSDGDTGQTGGGG